MVNIENKSYEEILKEAEKVRKEIDEALINNEFWNSLPDELKYYGIARIFTIEDYNEYLKENQEIIDAPIYDHHCHEFINSDGQIGTLEPSPNADWALARDTKIPR